ncbi:MULTISPECIES: hypothetical protein [Streptomyces]|uniref:hypothetical protein n=1 Tax=Streptomyces TaxID=1883 RepID=UPI0028AC8404|nr:hypothetical protein [Streptomyces parvus]
MCRTPNKGCVGRSAASRSCGLRDAGEIAQLKADIEALVGALHQSMVENRVLRQQLSDGVGAAAGALLLLRCSVPPRAWAAPRTRTG